MISVKYAGGFLLLAMLSVCCVLFIPMQNNFNGVFVLVFEGFVLFVSVLLLVREKRLEINQDLLLLYVLLIAWCAISIFWSQNKLVSFERLMHMITAFISALAVTLSLTRSDIFKLCRVFFIVLLFLDFIVILTYPKIGIMGGVSGFHYHKNRFAMIILIYIFFSLSDKSSLNYVIIGLLMSFIFLIGAKSAFGFGLITFLIVSDRARKKIFDLSMIRVLLLLSVFALFTLFFSGEYLIENYLHLVTDEFLTGRGFIWKLAIDANGLGWVGEGFGGVWKIGEQSFINYYAVDASTNWLKRLGHVHNGYLDVVLQVGYVGLFLLLILFFNIYRLIGRNKDNYGKISKSIITFTLLYNTTESSFLEIVNPLWYLLILVSLSASVVRKEKFESKAI